MQKAILITICSILVSALALAACAPASAPGGDDGTTAEEPEYEWRYQSSITAGDPRYELGEAGMFPEIVAARTNGRVKIVSYPAGTLAPSNELLDTCGQGLTEAVEACGNYWIGVMPVGGPETGLAGSFRDNNDVYGLFWDWGVEDFMREVYATHDVHYLTVLAMGGGGIISNKPIRTKADFEGLKIRGVGTYMDVVEKLGASPVFIDMGEIYLAFTTGTVDAVMTNWIAQLSMNMYEPGKYLVSPNSWETYTNHILVNADAWNELPPGLQSSVTGAAHEYSMWLSRYQQREDEKAKNELLEHLELSQIDEAGLAAMGEAALEVWDEYAAKDADSAKFIEMQKSYYEEMG